MTTISDIFEFTQSFAPIESAQEWDNCGLLVGDFDTAVSRVTVALDITPEVIKEAKENSSELIISHHPVIFEPLSSVEKNSCVYQLIDNSIAALCLHTNLDIASDCGVNVCLADALRLSNTELFADEFLIVGTLEKEMTAQQFAQHIKSCLGCLSLRYTDCKRPIKTVGVSSGAGSDSLDYASKLNCDGFVTGEIKHHKILQSQSLNISVFDGGHFKTEDVVISPLVKKLANRFPTVHFEKSKLHSDPMKFI